MIGVAASADDLSVAQEFFELFKTPWEPAVPWRTYQIVLSTDGCIEHLYAERFLVYSSKEVAADLEAGVRVERVDGPVDIEWNDSSFPVFGPVASFGGGAGTVTSGGKAVDYRAPSSNRVVRRIGYDLFGEIRYLLTAGQPASRALTPTLELHIALLRSLLLESGVSFVEIPPRPHGYDFICCLTHDIDFFGIRRHPGDRTLAGFAARASLGTLADLVRGRRRLTDAVRNWVALLSLPLVFLRLARDFWSPFEDYARVEDGRQSTFFLVPFKGRPGVAPNGAVEPARAVPYQTSEIREEAKKAAQRGSELAVHGIDAWRDPDAGRAEMAQLTSITGRATAGVRMHWLYFEADSPRRLEAAGFDYDSTWGYNDAVGYRAGTSQVFRLPASDHLMELPLSVMDSALFYRARMGLVNRDAFRLCVRIVANAKRFAGTVVINWHDRSLAPERLWGGFYRNLLKEVVRGNWVWFTTAGEAVDWFRWRRSIRFTSEPGSRVVTMVASAPNPTAPAAVVEIHRPARAVEAHRLDGHAPMTVEPTRVEPTRVKQMRVELMTVES
jgi:hypothetical protein